MGKIAVVGSLNMDYFIETDVLPKMGETVLGNHFFRSPGGKGANQAVAASRLGGDVTMFGSLGEDENGHAIREHLQKERVDLAHLNLVGDRPTGVAFVELCGGDNRIIVVPGANRSTNVNYMQRITTELLSYDVIVFQFETPLEIMDFIIPVLHRHGKIIIVNPAPAAKLNQTIIDKITYLTPNGHEFQALLDTNGSIDEILQAYPNKLIITLGDKGVSYHDGDQVVNIPCIEVTPVDTTGSGDTFTGALATALAEGRNLHDSILFANTAAGLSVTKRGAQSGMPYRNEVESLLRER
ncbi:Ribokinase [Chlamydia abortus]|uniref:Ribokinase n=1 Tax=Paenibacillus residui TaxID=629724 RepID=A0ABW3DAE8_9BACL|nr:Ribokinase [Chlamydia abortus]